MSQATLTPGNAQLELPLFTGGFKCEQITATEWRVRAIVPKRYSPEISTRKAAEIIGCDERSVRRLCEDGLLPFRRAPRTNIKIRTIDAMRWRETTTSEATSGPLAKQN